MWDSPSGWVETENLILPFWLSDHFLSNHQAWRRRAKKDFSDLISFIRKNVANTSNSSTQLCFQKMEPMYKQFSVRFCLSSSCAFTIRTNSLLCPWGFLLTISMKNLLHWWSVLLTWNWKFFEMLQPWSVDQLY